jgi:hypothetical protein
MALVDRAAQLLAEGARGGVRAPQRAAT